MPSPPPSSAVAAARAFVDMYYPLVSHGLSADLALHYTPLAQKSVSVGGAHSVVTGRDDVARQIAGLAGAAFAVRGVVAQDSHDGRGAHVLITGLVRTAIPAPIAAAAPGITALPSALTPAPLGPACPFAHSVSLVPADGHPLVILAAKAQAMRGGGGREFELRPEGQGIDPRLSPSLRLSDPQRRPVAAGDATDSPCGARPNARHPTPPPDPHSAATAPPSATSPAAAARAAAAFPGPGGGWSGVGHWGGRRRGSRWRPQHQQQHQQQQQRLRHVQPLRQDRHGHPLSQPLPVGPVQPMATATSTSNPAVGVRPSHPPGVGTAEGSGQPPPAGGRIAVGEGLGPGSGSGLGHPLPPTTVSASALSYRIGEGGGWGWGWGQRDGPGRWSSPSAAPSGAVVEIKERRMIPSPLPSPTFLPSLEVRAHATVQR